MKEAIELCTHALLHPFEGYHRRLPNGDCESYPDPASPLARGRFSKVEVAQMTPDQLLKAGHPWTIGWGTTGPDIVPGLVWTRKQADDRFEASLSKFVQGAITLSPGLVTELPRRLAAIIVSATIVDWATIESALFVVGLTRVTGRMRTIKYKSGTKLKAWCYQD